LKAMAIRPGQFRTCTLLDLTMISKRRILAS
jgi:hypothetical protein